MKFFILNFIVLFSMIFPKNVLFSQDTVVLAFDVETSGPDFIRNGIVSIGSCVIGLDSKEIDSFQKNMLLQDGRDYDERCLNDFWLKNPEAHSRRR